LGKSYDGITGATRTIPSAGAIYPLEIYVLIGNEAIKGIQAGLYRYLIDKHSLELKISQDLRPSLAKTCLNQDFIIGAPIALIITAQSKLTTGHYGQRGLRYVFAEAGHTCQNIYLITEALGLSTVEVGAFDDNKLKELLLLDKLNDTLMVMPIGYRQ
jgi:SagB-type dehydrogenase family enzyme